MEVFVFLIIIYILYIQFDELQIRGRDKNKYNQNTKNHD